MYNYLYLRADVAGWVAQGGAFLGTKRTIPTAENMPLIAEQLKKLGIQGLLVIGGFEAFHTVLMITESRSRFPAFCIPLVVIPATISESDL
jgi:6-phosphofructokinase 1